MRVLLLMVGSCSLSTGMYSYNLLMYLYIESCHGFFPNVFIAAVSQPEQLVDLLLGQMVHRGQVI